MAIGAALAKKMNNDSSIVYALCGDGELNEGQNWEALMFAPHKKVDNLILTIDRNGQQIDGPTDKVMHLESLHAKLDAFNWDVLEVGDGNNIDEVIEGLELAKSRLGKGKPVVIILNTIMGHGVDFMAGSHEWHGIAPNDEQLALALSQLYIEDVKDYE